MEDFEYAIDNYTGKLEDSDLAFVGLISGTLFIQIYGLMASVIQPIVIFLMTWITTMMCAMIAVALPCCDTRAYVFHCRKTRMICMMSFVIGCIMMLVI